MKLESDNDLRNWNPVIRELLFVCAGNICRSPMGEAFFNHLVEQQRLSMRARSAGVNVVLDDATTEAILAAGEYGVDLSNHSSRQLNEEMIRNADLILTMTGSHARVVQRDFPSACGKTFVLLEFAGGSGDISDPYGNPLQVYRQCARQIWEAVQRTLERLQKA